MSSPLQAIRQKCLDCCLGSAAEVRACTSALHCLLHPYRRGRPAGAVTIRPLKVIKAYCFECGEGTRADVVNCPEIECSLYPFRMGKNPNRIGRILDEEQKTNLRERLARVREAKNAQ